MQTLRLERSHESGSVMSAADHKARGNEAFQAGRYADAIDSYSLALDFDGDSAWNTAILCNRAFARLQLGAPDQAALAEVDCSTVLQLDPVNVKALFRRAQARMVLANLTGAKTDLESIVSLEPGNPQANETLDRVRMQLAAQTNNGMFNPAFQANLLRGIAPVTLYSPPPPHRLKSPRQCKVHDVNHRNNEDFAEALRQCSIVAHEEAESHASRDKKVSLAAWEDLQAQERSVTKSTRGVTKQVKRAANRVQSSGMSSSTAAVKPGPIKVHTDALWAQLMEDEVKTCSLYKAKIRSKQKWSE
ncbi:hypothetical protein H310_04004 [Aphanomyces invadans]|uniref:Uncharacterized protein n=1 Tax=Aphanomyces invadans TaxID=157072 RepID=A0A024UGC9_9STRA|nr:hypothetical protein H310_04004 [Aphanomyces invadans]ETW04897.1 hypothetical protein H310_04004 [Aphanomyces invadans]|eukprot:XP_008866335.1 hypothetical protein H310_04004 [Aphanomyces invadans]